MSADTPATAVEREREAFEAWAMRDGWSLDTWGGAREGEYMDARCEGRWQGWLARASLANAPDHFPGVGNMVSSAPRPSREEVADWKALGFRSAEDKAAYERKTLGEYDPYALSASAGGDGWRTPPGWKLVPEEPTEAMLDVAEEASREALFLRTQNLFAWRLMLSAAPTPPDPETAADREA